MYMQTENAAVVTKCHRIQHVPSNLRNYKITRWLHPGVAFLYVLSIYAIQNQHYTMHACARTSKAFKVQSRDIIRLLVTSPFKTVHFQLLLFFSKNIMTKLMGAFLQTNTDEKQIENSNIQLNNKIITLLVLKENAFKVGVNFQISRFPSTLTLTSPKKMKF